MKTNKIERKGRMTIVVTAIVAIVLVGVGAIVCYDRLKGLYLEQCVINDMAKQVSVTSGKMVKADVIAENLGLRTGANLATIDFSEKRRELLEKVPNLKSIHISRQLPDKVTVVAEERTPVARLGLVKAQDPSGRVVDTEGMVFVWQRGTLTLPLIRESKAPGTPRGSRIQGRTLAALRLVETCREAEFLELGLLEVDTSKHDFLIATLGNYSKLKILWTGMDEAPTPESDADLKKRLTQLRAAIRSKVVPNAVIWNATIPDRIFPDTQEKL